MTKFKCNFRESDEHGDDNSCGTVEYFMLIRVRPKGNAIYDAHPKVIFAVPSYSCSKGTISA